MAICHDCGVEIKEEVLEPDGMHKMSFCSLYKGAFYGINDNDKVIVCDPKNEFTNMIKDNVFELGVCGSGKAYHPWDGLKECSCGGYPLMVGTDGTDFYSGSPYKIICIKCSKSTTTNENISVIKIQWNEQLN